MWLYVHAFMYNKHKWKNRHFQHDIISKWQPTGTNAWHAMKISLLSSSGFFIDFIWFPLGFSLGFIGVSYGFPIWISYGLIPGKKPLLCVKLLPDLFVVLLPGPAFMSRAVLAQNRLGDGPACDRKLYIYKYRALKMITRWGSPSYKLVSMAISDTYTRGTVFWGYISSHSPYIGLAQTLYGRYLQ